MAWLSAQNLVLLAILLTRTCCTGQVSHFPPGATPQWIPGFLLQQEAANKCISRWMGKDKVPSDHVAAVYLHTHSLPGLRDQLLSCSISKLLANLKRTQVHVYVFVSPESLQHIQDMLQQDLGKQASKVCLLTVPQEQWHFKVTPQEAYQLEPNRNKWTAHPEGYLNMGTWRLLVPFTLAAKLGYPYVLQLDDDLMVLKPMEVDIVERMRSGNHTFASHRMPVEFWFLTQGLPELALFFLESNKLEAGGSLWQHVNPPNKTGLFTPHGNWWRPKGPEVPYPKEGYDLTVLYGNFLVVSTQLWMSPQVQDWVKLCLASGGMERHRWQEQSVMSWVWLLFTDPHQLWFISREELDWMHTRQERRLRAVCGQFMDPEPVPAGGVQPTV